jgi:lambda family phage tail tape measure protein
MPSQIREVRVIAKTSGSKELKDLAKQFSSTNKSVSQLSKGFSGLKNVFGGFLATLGLREITRASDEFQLFRDRITAFVGDSKVATQVFEDIVDVARRTKTSVSALGDIYNRVALSTKDLGLNNRQIIETVEILQNTFRIAGSSIAEATGATIQLTQGLSAGALRGQELRSVLEANAVLADILAKEFGIARGQLIKFAETGQITAEKVLKALATNAEEVQKKADKLGQTFEQSTIIALDAFKKKISELNTEFGVSSAFAKGVELFVDNIDSLGKALGAIIATGSLIALLKQLKNIDSFLKGSFILRLAGKGGIAGIITAAVGGTVFAIDKLQDKLDESNTRTGLEKRLKELRGELKLIAKEQESVGSKKDGGFLGRLGTAINPFKKTLGEVNQEFNVTKKEIAEIEKKLAKLGPTIKNSEKGLKDFSATSKTLKQQYAEIAKNFLVFQDLNENISDKELAKLGKQVRSISNEFLKAKRSAADFKNEIEELVALQQPMSFWQSIMAGFNDGVSSTKDEFKTLAQEISGATQSAFGGLESAIFDSLKGSKDAFARFTQAVLDDLLKIAIRLTITNQLAAALSSSLGGGGAAPSTSSAYNYTGASANVAATAYNGKVFNSGNVVPHYNGGIVDSPGAFPMSGGRIGTIAERGPEAIMPLERGSDGKLGVKSKTPQTVINVINNTPSDVQTKETKGPGGQRQIEILVNETVKKGVVNGEFDKSFNGRYNLKPRGR